MSLLPPIQKQNKPLPPRARQIVANVIKFVRHEANYGISVGLRACSQRALSATGLSYSSHCAIIQETKKAKRNKIDRFAVPEKESLTYKEKQVRCLERVKFLRGLIHKYCDNEKRPPSLDELLTHTKTENTLFCLGKNELTMFIRTIGLFHWISTKSNSKFLIESYDVRYKRFQYLKKILDYRQRERPIIYLDKKSIDYLYLYQLCKDDVLMTLSRSKRCYEGFVIMYAIGDSGLLPNSSLANLECESFPKWLETQLLPNLPPRSVLIIDNNTYQSINVDDVISTKAQMIEWLQTRHLTYDVAMTKAELYAIIKSYKSENPTCKLDKLLERYGFDVLKLPAYHPELSPISGFWGKIQELFISQKTNFVLKEIKDLIQEKFDAITPNDWIELHDRVKIIEKEYLERENVFDKIMDELEIILKYDNNDSKEDYRAEDEVVAVEELSDDEVEESPNQNDRIGNDLNESIVLKEEVFRDDLIEIDDWKPPILLTNGEIKDGS